MPLNNGEPALLFGVISCRIAEGSNNVNVISPFKDEEAIMLMLFNDSEMRK